MSSLVINPDALSNEVEEKPEEEISNEPGRTSTIAEDFTEESMDLDPQKYSTRFETVTEAPELPCWTFRIEGYILDPSQQYPVACGKKFSEFLRKIIIEEVDQSSEKPSKLSRDNVVGEKLFEWTKTIVSKETDGFEIKRLGSGKKLLKIYLLLDYLNDKFHPSKELQSVLRLGSEISSKSAFLVDIWRYITVRWNFSWTKYLFLIFRFVDC